ncbi:efflux RND transporter permease subunit [bacterium]|nr:efflux RND transporter permease subunit [bacterium]MCI0606126.1 efflux RND transporter permease subunit [bacterium]
MKIAEISIRRPITVGMVTVAVLMFGIVAFGRLPLNLLPDISYPSLTVETKYTQAAPNEVENLVSKPIEEAVAVVSGGQRIYSRSRAGVSEVTMEFGWDSNMDFAALDVREKLDLVQLPRDAEKPNILRFDPSNDPILRVILSSPHSNLIALREFAEKTIKKDLESIDGIAAVKINGGLEEEIHVFLDETKLASVGLSVQEVVNTLSRNNINIAGGSLYENEARYLVRTLNEFQMVSELNDLVVREDAQRKILLKDVARIDRGTKEREIITRINGEEGVEMAIFKEGDANTVQVARVAKDRLKVIQEGVGNKNGNGNAKESSALVKSGIQMEIMFDQSKFIQDAIDDVRSNAIFGGLIAVFVLFLFLKEFRSTGIIGLSIPISVIGTFFVMYQLNIKLNIMSLGGLALGVGMLVDNAVVVLESIVRHFKEGKSLATAAYDGTKEVGLAVSASTITTVVVFLPISFIEGIAGQLFKDLAVTVTVSLLVSMVAAFALIPMLYSRGVHSEREEVPEYKRRSSRFVFFTAPSTIVKVFRKGFGYAGKALHTLFTPFIKITDSGLNAFYRSYPPILRSAVRHRFLVIMGSLVLLAASLAVIANLGVELIPPMSQGEFSFEMELPDGTPLQQTNLTLLKIEDQVRKFPEVKNCMVLIGRNANVSWTAAESYENSAVMNIKVQGKDLKVAETQASQKIRALLERHPDLHYKLQRPSLFSFRTPVEVEVYSDDLKTASQISSRIESNMQRITGLTDIKSSWEEGSPEAHIIFNRDQLSRFNLRLEDVANILKSKVQGEVATEFREGDDEIDIRVWNEMITRNSIEDLENMTVAKVNEVPIPLNQVASVTMGRGPNEIRRVNQKRAIVLSANLQGASLGNASEQIKKMLSETEMPGGVTATLSGQSEELQRSFRSLYLVGALAFFLVYFVMAAQFESLLQPFILMFTVPLALIGVAWILWATNQDISVIVIMGFIILAGIVVNNGIILVDYINTIRKKGVPLMDAMIEAGKVRIRPILMTTLTTLLGMLPMAFTSGEGSEIRAPLAITLIGGLSVSTLLTMIIIPILYSMTEGRRVDIEELEKTQPGVAEAANA